MQARLSVYYPQERVPSMMTALPATLTVTCWNWTVPAGSVVTVPPVPLDELEPLVNET